MKLLIGVFGILSLNIFCISNIALAYRINSTYNVRVEIEAPWFISFTLPIKENFVPISMSGILEKHATNKKYIQFTSYVDEQQQRVFRNVEPMRLERGNRVLGTLAYETTDSRGSENVTFSYTVTTKTFDVLPVRAQVEQYLPLPTLPELENDLEATEHTAKQNASGQPYLPNSLSTICGDYFAKQQQSQMLELEQLLQTAFDLQRIGKWLLLEGMRTTDSDAMDMVRSVFTNNLQSPQLNAGIVQARVMPEGILMEMSTSRQKLEVLMKAQQLLQGTHFKIKDSAKDVTTDSNFVALYQRTLL